MLRATAGRTLFALLSCLGTWSSVAATLNNLHQYLDLLRREKEIVDVDAPVSSDLEIAEIHRRVIAAGGPALLFRNVEGADFACVTNLFGTPRRVEMAFGPRPERFLRELVSLAQDLPSLSPGASASSRTSPPPTSGPSSALTPPPGISTPS